MSRSDGGGLAKVHDIGFNRRYAPVITAAKEALNGAAPDVIIAQKNRPQTEYHATLENAVHMADFMRYFCGEAADVQAISKFADRDYETGIKDARQGLTFPASPCLRGNAVFSKFGDIIIEISALMR